MGNSFFLCVRVESGWRRRLLFVETGFPWILALTGSSGKLIRDIAMVCSRIVSVVQPSVVFTRDTRLFALARMRMVYMIIWVALDSVRYALGMRTNMAKMPIVIADMNVRGRPFGRPDFDRTIASGGIGEIFVVRAIGRPMANVPAIRLPCVCIP